MRIIHLTLQTRDVCALVLHKHTLAHIRLGCPKITKLSLVRLAATINPQAHNGCGLRRHCLDLHHVSNARNDTHTGATVLKQEPFSHSHTAASATCAAEQAEPNHTIRLTQQCQEKRG